MGNCLPNPFLKKNSNKINKTKKRKAKQREKERWLPEHSESMCCWYHTSKENDTNSI
jgi:hypothetical protein